MRLAKFLDAYPVWAAYRLHERLVVPMQKNLKENDITFLQSMILAAIYFEQRAVSPSELVAMLGTSLPNISHSLKHLRFLHYVEREIDSGDARKTRYDITTQAKSCLQHIINLHHATQEMMEKEFSPHEIAAWCGVAERLSRCSNERPLKKLAR